MNTHKTGNDPFYTGRDKPTRAEKSEMWRTIRDQLPGGQARPVSIHWKSFWIGQAAAVFLILAFIGAWALWNNIGPDSSPTNGLRNTYTHVLRDVASAELDLEAPKNAQKREALNSQLKGLEEVDRIINEIRNDILINGSSKAKRQQLRRLYATKLEFVQKLLLTEEEST